MEYLSYLDPGTGSIIVQAVIGAVAGVGIFGRRAFSGMRDKFQSTIGRKK